jgi:predicted nucleotidyltransferase
MLMENAAMMNRDLIVTILQEHQDNLMALGDKLLAVFGSVERNDADAESDIDILVTFRDTPVTFDVYLDVKIYLEDSLEEPVDLVIADSLHSRIRPFVQQDAVHDA